MRTKLLLILLSGVIFTIPSNLFVKFFETTAYSNGIFVDYLLPKFYLSDFFVIGFIGLSLFSIKKPTRKLAHHWLTTHWLLAILTGCLLCRQLFVSHPLAAWWYVGKLVEILAFGYVLWRQRNLLKKPFITYVVLATILFQSTLAIFQYHTQHSLAGYWLLGEPRLPQTFGLATQVINGIEKISPYGTTAHPNILGGILVVYIIIIFSHFQKKLDLLRLIKLVVIVIGLYGLLLTSSISAWLTLAIGTVVLAGKKRFTATQELILAALIFFIIPISILLAKSSFPLLPSITRRATLSVQALIIFSRQPLWGTGLNQFTAYPFLPSFHELVRFVQPVHHIGLLWLAETGVVGLVILGLIMRKINLKKIAVPLLVLTPLAALDHYLLTQQSGLLLSVLTVIYFAKF